ncbi:uncharacterized protein NECHADRAFT_92268 [Fusarium vanettenii 77-13-4]|uniref:Short-chain dehydrogenase n=1 Tax=Fusarium vanettenii (strain ATCC MYA-4622 / CBS 123669 / FGSC 9596 / NRRL 45880 / 77-13-4) TaxID=660122 RepID=C7ZFA5_FUSV7|nr:uncharacterized protein NECHADRAFT_92268 [Fusarium vanettenii 77-13-4]EEU37186.1 hypothetical protein NECHADRAFT_92268 [Fusarium vanettenii 77-13-4]
MSAPNHPVILIFGAGANTGYGVADSFSRKGYKVAIVSRGALTPVFEERDFLHIRGDLADAASVEAAYQRTVDELGTPSVVVHNGESAYASTMAPDNADPIQLPVADLAADLAINTTSVLQLLQLATSSFAKLPDSTSRTFIYTGNKANLQPFPPFLSLGVGKAASSHMISFAAKTYSPQGYKFYYADQRNEDGSPVLAAIDGKAHGEFYTELAESKTQGPWLASFVKGKGYVKFEE